MWNQRNETLRYVLLGSALLLGLTNFGCATHGLLEIDQDTALAGGVTPGDTAGFPVTISHPGSYRLTSNLTVPATNTAGAIFVTADDVTVDLNGFGIFGPTTCTKTLVSTSVTCSNAGGGFGIFAPTASNTAVVNGTVRGMGNDGIFLRGRVERVNAISNGGAGIVASTVIGCRARFNGNSGIAGKTVIANEASFNGSAGISVSGTARNNSANFNDQDGIFATSATVIGNEANENNRHGIHAPGGVNVANATTVIGNAISENGSFGIFFGTVAVGGYANNVLSNNGGTVSGGLQIGTNVCNGNTTCP